LSSDGSVFENWRKIASILKINRISLCFGDSRVCRIQDFAQSRDPVSCFGIAVFGRSTFMGRGIRSAAAEKNSSGQDDERNNGVRAGSFEFVRFAVKDSETFCAAV